MTPVYKIVTEPEWHRWQAETRYPGSADDRRDGFVHLSTAAQVAATAAKHFAGLDDLVLVEVDGAALGAALRFEPSRGGALFPHCYGPLPLSAVRRATPLARDADGRHVIPALAT